MERLLICVALVLGCRAVQASSVAAVAQEQATQAAKASEGAAGPTKPGIADGASSPDEMGNRRPLYRLRKSDVIEIKFNFASEFNQTVSLQADGFIPLKGWDERVRPSNARAAEDDPPGLFRMRPNVEVTIEPKDLEKPYLLPRGRGACRQVRIARHQLFAQLSLVPAICWSTFRTSRHEGGNLRIRCLVSAIATSVWRSLASASYLRRSGPQQRPGTYYDPVREPCDHGPVVYNQSGPRHSHHLTRRGLLTWKRRFWLPEDRASSVPISSCNGLSRSELRWLTSTN